MCRLINLKEKVKKTPNQHPVGYNWEKSTWPLNTLSGTFKFLRHCTAYQILKINYKLKNNTFYTLKIIHFNLRRSYSKVYPQFDFSTLSSCLKIDISSRWNIPDICILIIQKTILRKNGKLCFLVPEIYNKHSQAFNQYITKFYLWNAFEYSIKLPCNPKFTVTCLKELDFNTNIAVLCRNFCN